QQNLHGQLDRWKRQFRGRGVYRLGDEWAVPRPRPGLARHDVQEAAAVLAVVDAVVTAQVREGGGGDGGEAAEADAVDDGHDGAAAGPGEAVESAAHLGRQLLLQLVDALAELEQGALDVDVELLLLEC